MSFVGTREVADCSAEHAAVLGIKTAKRFIKMGEVAPWIDYDDLVGEAVLAALAARLTYREGFGTTFSTWVIGAARNAVFSHFRAEGKGRGLSVQMADQDPEEVAASYRTWVIERDQEVLPELDLSYVYAKVTAPQAEAIRLLVEEGVSFVEAGKRLGIHRKAVYDRLEGAERRLRRAR